VIEKKIKGTRVKLPYRQAKNAKGDTVGGGISKKRGRKKKMEEEVENKAFK
jgi:hypothetical protein